MTTESVQNRYINDNKGKARAKTPVKTKPSKLDADLEIFALREQQDGLKPSVASKHVRMIRTALEVIEERRDVAHTQITPADLQFLEETLTVREYNWPVSYVRILAKFVSVITGKAPMIPLGKMGFKFNDEALFITRTKTLGTAMDRQRIMSEHGAQIATFLDAMKEVKFDNKSEKCLCAAIFVFENVNGEFDPGTASLEDLERMRIFLTDFGVSRSGRYVSLMVRFISFITGEPQLRKINSRPPNEDWTTGLSEQCPFVNQIAEYARLLDTRNMSRSRKDATLKKAQVFGAMLHIRFGVKTLDDVEPEMLDSVCKEVSTHICPTSARLFRGAFLDFASYFGREDLHQQMIPSTRKGQFVPKDDSDREFKEKLDDWAVYLNQWEYKSHTITERLIAAKVCYKTLKQVKGPFNLESLVPLDIQTIRNAMFGYSESTIRLYLQMFGWFLKFAIGRDLYDEAHIWFSRGVTKRNFVTMDEFRKLWRVAGPTERMILALGGAMGIRKQEMIELRLSDFSASAVTIRGKGPGPEGKVVQMEIPDLVREALAEYLPFRSELLMCGDRSDDRLLVNPNSRDLGRPMTESCHQTIVRKLSKKAGVYFTTHGLRRMYATNLADAGLDLDTIRRMMRHSSIDTTLTCYILADPRKMHGAVNSVNSIFSAINLDRGINRFYRTGTTFQTLYESVKNA